MKPCSRLKWYMLLLLVAANSAFDCYENANCTCILNNKDAKEILCSMEDDSMFTIRMDQSEADYTLQVLCSNSPKWSDFNIQFTAPADDVKTVIFQMCPLPNNSLSEITKRLGVTKVETLVFRSYSNLSSNLERKHLKGFPELKVLTLTYNGLTDLPIDLLEDLPELVRLDLRNNEVHLPKHIFKSVNKLNTLELGLNKLTQMNPEVLSDMPNLHFLNLWGNLLTELQPNMFDNLTALTTLGINRNRLITLPPDVFESLEKLKTLFIFRNNFSSLPEKLFSNNKNLEVLKLHSNDQNLTTLPNKFLNGLTNLTEVDLKRNGLQYLPEDMLWGASSLRNLSLERNYLDTLPQNIFKDLKELRTLDLNTNEFRELPDGLFSKLSNLEKLNLSKNHLFAISEKLLSGLRSLKEIDIANNELTSIHNQGFNGVNNLRIIRLSNNQLTLSENAFPDDFTHRKISPFFNCRFLNELHLAHNNISEIFSDWLINKLELRLLDLKFNQLSFIENNDLEFLSNEIKVDLSHNNISTILMKDAEGAAIGQTIPRNVIIDMGENPIVCDCMLYDFLRYLKGDMHPNVQNFYHIKSGNLQCTSPDWLEGKAVSTLELSSLKCIVEDMPYCPEKCTCWIRPHDKAFLVDCSNKSLSRAPENIKVISNDYHIELNLSGNSLTKMPSHNQSGYESVTMMFLSYNNISSVSLDTLPPNIKTLDLHHNNLTRVDSEVLEFIANSTSLTKLTLHGNPWICDCEARDFLILIQKKLKEIPELHQIECSNSKLISEMTITELCPVVNGMIVGSSISIALLGLITGALATLYYRYQREVKVWLYAHQLCLWFVTEEELDKDKLYDAFISYSHKDEKFVLDELVSKLETGPNPYKLCLHFRDWLAGEWIPAQIARSVEDSKRTIVVLSDNFLESVWGRMEFRAAHSQALSEGRARVIVVLLGDVGPTDNLDPELKAYLSMNTYVKWGDPWFLDKLRYALPHPPKFPKRNTKIYKSHQPRIQLNNDKNKLFHSSGVPESPPPITTPPADSLKIFAHDVNIKHNGVTTDSQPKDTCDIKDSDVENGFISNKSVVNDIHCTPV